MRTIQQILEDAGYETRAYSGRGMMGKECLAVEYDGNIGKVFADVLDAIDPDVSEGETSEIAAVAHAFRTMRQDSMGLGSIVYFPRIAFEP